MIDTSQSIAEKHKEFYDLATPHMELLGVVARKMTGNATEAQDLSQDVYLRAYRYFDTFQKGTNFKAWLFTILRNTYVNGSRKASKLPRMIDISIIETHDNVKSATTPETEIFDELLDDVVINAMDALPEHFREAVMLCDLEGLSYKEMTEALDCPIGTVMSRLHRGRGLLRERLKGYAKQNGYARD